LGFIAFQLTGLSLPVGITGNVNHYRHHSVVSRVLISVLCVGLCPHLPADRRDFYSWLAAVNLF
jgi:hypothetical protein